MTASEKAVQSRSAGPKVFLGWADDDALVLLGEIVGTKSNVSHDATLSDLDSVSAWLLEGGPLRFAGGISSRLPRSQRHKFEAETTVPRVWSGTRIAHAVLPGDVFGAWPTAHNVDPVRKSGVRAVDVDLFTGGRFDCHSAPLSDLIGIELIIGSVKRAVLGVLDSLIYHAGLARVCHADLEDSGYDREWTGLAYSDDAADYPPMSRNYADVKVGISGADRAKPRRYTDEDHQIWGHSLHGD